MDNSLLKKILPHAIALVIMAVIAFVFFSPYTFEGKTLQQGDNDRALASQTEINKVKKETGKAPLWTNAFFSGMPTVQIHSEVNGNLTRPFLTAALLGQAITAPHTAILLAMLCMYFLLLTLHIDWRIALTGATAFGLSTFNIDITEAGHSTQMIALALAPGVLGSAILVFRGKYWLGGGLFALFVALQVYSNHYQVTYYTFLMLLVLGIVELTAAIRGGRWVHFGLSAGVLVAGLGLGVLSNLSTIWTTAEYQSETIRGKSDLKKGVSKNSGGESGGLTRDYAWGWSYGIGETGTLLIPNYYGGGASQTYTDTKTYETVYNDLIGRGATKEQAQGQLRQYASLYYTGAQPFLGAAIYYGAIIVFLFILGMILVDNNWKWWLASAALFMIVIAWGGNFSLFNGLLFDYFPMFNKFRAVTQALGLGQLAFAALGALGLQAWFDERIPAEKKMRALYIALGVTGVFCLTSLAGGDAIGQHDKEVGQLASLLKEDRADLIRGDSMRSLFLIVIAAGLLWASLKGYIQKTWITVAVIGALSLGDVWSVSKRILPNEKYLTAQESKANTRQNNPTDADKKILADPDPYFRVLDLTSGNPFASADASFFHKSVGGYHAAKLMRYQELIEKYLSRIDSKQGIVDPAVMKIYSMLNTKYIIQPKLEKTEAVLNPDANGNAWFVKNIQTVADADAELETLGTINPKETALISQPFMGALQGFTPQFDSSNSIKLTSYNPDVMKYEYSANTDQLAVFSEVYYPPSKGWTLYLNGQPIAPFIKADYTLRAAKLPAGKNQKLEMRFAPASYYTGEKVSMFASALLLLCLAGGLFLFFKRYQLPEAERLPLFTAPAPRKTVVITPTAVRAPTPKNPQQKQIKRKK